MSTTAYKVGRTRERASDAAALLPGRCGSVELAHRFKETQHHEFVAIQLSLAAKQ
jgi:hypothetical protein